jgi:hypothetical protein
VLVLVSFISAGAGAYFGGYLKTKGENFATHEDIGKLVDQVAAVTQTTKEIEAQISNKVWDRQKLWEMKREVLFDTVKRIAEIDEALVGLNATVQVEQKPEDPGWRELITERRDAWKAATVGFDEAKLLVSMVCGKDTALTKSSVSVCFLIRSLENSSRTEIPRYMKSQQRN